MATSRVEARAWLLHSTPYRETSLVADLFTREHGRIAAVAKGAKRPRSALRAVLLQFQPLRVVYSGQRELRTLTGAEWVGGLAAPQGDSLLCAFYLNELLLRLLAREDPHPPLFDAYTEAITRLGEGGAPLDEVLRRFEWRLLREIGYAPDLERDASSRPIEASLRYSWSPGSGFVACESGDESAVSGATLHDIAAGHFGSLTGRQQAKYLSRAILSHYLDGAPLNTRQILIDLQRL
ncbi:MAG: DNA repair protein RecO [Burkholderiaceae bacterium]|nr:DNA repair protein RecO [Burkholderiaceae bacterium]